MSKWPSHLNSPSPCFSLVISVVQPPWMLLHSGHVVLGPSSTPLIMSSGPSCCSMTRPFDGPMQMRSKKHLTGWRASLVMLGDPVTAWSMAHSSLSCLSLDTLEQFFNHKSNYSLSLMVSSIFTHGSLNLLVLQLITLPNLHIINYVLGPPGSVHNSMAFKESGQLFHDGEWLWANLVYALQPWSIMPYK